MNTRHLDAKMMIEEMMYRGDSRATYIFNGEYDQPVDHDLIFSCYDVAKEKGIEIEVEWREGEKITIEILTPFK
uniref:Uncharacterized protein n=1 Tax=Ochrobactrum phage ORM_20 TaxID=2985243 RepID=A0A9N6ZF36_9VIRU|nr:hypothetical protein ORM20_00199 [Ochrobactrum phage ORM_20]